jgi:branched-chain amino acid transport system substrate-binding protein
MIQGSIRALRKAAAVAAVVIGAMGFGLGGAQAAEPIKIGTFLAVTGPASFLGDPELKTLEMYVEQINAAGGVIGRPLELVSYDAQHDAKKAVTWPVPASSSIRSRSGCSRRRTPTGSRSARSSRT